MGPNWITATCTGAPVGGVPAGAATAAVRAARRRPLLSPSRAASNRAAARTPCWDRLASAQRQAAAPSPDPGAERAVSAVGVGGGYGAWRGSSSGNGRHRAPARRHPAWRRLEAPCLASARTRRLERPVPAAAPPPDLVQGSVAEVSVAEAASVAAWQPQPGPAVPNRAAARRPCSDRPCARVRRQGPAAGGGAAAGAGFRCRRGRWSGRWWRSRDRRGRGTAREAGAGGRRRGSGRRRIGVVAGAGRAPASCRSRLCRRACAASGLSPSARRLFVQLAASRSRRGRACLARLGVALGGLLVGRFLLGLLAALGGDDRTDPRGARFVGGGKARLVLAARVGRRQRTGDTATLRSAPGRAFWLLRSLPPPNQPQPDSRTRADTPSRLRQRRKLPILSCSRRIVVTRCPCSEV